MMACMFIVQRASLAAGVTFGPAKDADIVSVRVYECDGDVYRSTLLVAYDWIFHDAVHGNKAEALVSVSCQKCSRQIVHRVHR